MQAERTSRFVTLLAWLSDLAVHEGGFELRGVRGWATPAEVEDGTRAPRVTEDLAALFRRGDLMREDVGVPDASHPLWAYRIPSDSVTDRVIRSGPHVYLRSGVVVALDAMRHAFDETARRPRIPGEPEWQTTRDLTSWARAEAARTGHDRWFISEDIQWAVKNGLVEKRIVPPPAGSPATRPVQIYRLTITGAAVQPLIWHAPSRAG
jgi:hypothetical protein